MTDDGCANSIRYNDIIQRLLDDIFSFSKFNITKILRENIFNIIADSD